MEPIITKGKHILGGNLKKSAEYKVKHYDFRRPDKFSKEQILTESIMHETFARLATASLSAMTRSKIQMHVSSVDQFIYNEFIHTIPSPATMAILLMTPLKDSAVLEIDPNLTFTLMQSLMGGKAHNKTEKRNLTDIEGVRFEYLLACVLPDLGKAWQSVIDLHPHLGQYETNPQFAMIVPPVEMVIIVVFNVKVGEYRG